MDVQRLSSPTPSSQTAKNSTLAAMLLGPNRSRCKVIRVFKLRAYRNSDSSTQKVDRGHSRMLKFNPVQIGKQRNTRCYVKHFI